MGECDRTRKRTRGDEDVDLPVDSDSPRFSERNLKKGQHGLILVLGPRHVPDVGRVASHERRAHRRGATGGLARESHAGNGAKRRGDDGQVSGDISLRGDRCRAQRKLRHELFGVRALHSLEQAWLEGHEGGWGATPIGTTHG